MDDAAVMTSHRSLQAAGEADAILEVGQLVDLFRARATRRTPLRQRSLPTLERAVRRHVAETLLADVVPALLGELLEAAADDLAPLGPKTSSRTWRRRPMRTSGPSSWSSAARLS